MLGSRTFVLTQGGAWGAGAGSPGRPQGGGVPTLPGTAARPVLVLPLPLSPFRGRELCFRLEQCQLPSEDVSLEPLIPTTCLSQGCLCAAGVGTGAPAPPLGTGSGDSFPRASGAEPGHPAGLSAISVAPLVCLGPDAGTWRVTARLCWVLREGSSPGRWSLLWSPGAVALAGSSGPSPQQPWRA